MQRSNKMWKCCSYLHRLTWSYVEDHRDSNLFPRNPLSPHKHFDCSGHSCDTGDCRHWFHKLTIHPRPLLPRLWCNCYNHHWTFPWQDTVLCLFHLNSRLSSSPRFPWDHWDWDCIQHFLLLSAMNFRLLWVIWSDLNESGFQQMWELGLKQRWVSISNEHRLVGR